MVKVLLDYYAFLKIRRDADIETIKQAYKKAMENYDSAKKYSPKTERFYQIIQDAYIVLTDEKKRAKYDALLDTATYTKTAKKIKNNNDIKEAIDVASDLNEKYNLGSKLLNVGFNVVKGGSMLGGAKLMFGGAIAGYGMKKGKDYIIDHYTVKRR